MRTSLSVPLIYDSSVGLAVSRSVTHSYLLFPVALFAGHIWPLNNARCQLRCFIPATRTSWTKFWMPAASELRQCNTITKPSAHRIVKPANMDAKKDSKSRHGPPTGPFHRSQIPLPAHMLPIWASIMPQGSFEPRSHPRAFFSTVETHSLPFRPHRHHVCLLGQTWMMLGRCTCSNDLADPPLPCCTPTSSSSFRTSRLPLYFTLPEGLPASSSCARGGRGSSQATDRSSPTNSPLPDFNPTTGRTTRPGIFFLFAVRGARLAPILVDHNGNVCAIDAKGLGIKQC
jgi:hypothetical protein